MTTVDKNTKTDYLIQNYHSIISRRKSQKMATVKEPENMAELETLIKNNKYMVSLEDEEINAMKKIKRKKEIISYTANRDKLFIPHLEKIERPVDISDKIIENKILAPLADLGIQSDPIEFENLEKPFVPHKIGRDVGVQIEDGDLFDFERDVQPLIIVLSGKVLEQALLELHEEEEIKNLREMKQIYIKKFQDERVRMKNIEKIEIKLKKDNEALKKIKILEKITKINTQRKLFARSFAKQYLNNLTKSSINDLKNHAMFVDYSVAFLKNKCNEDLFNQIEQNNILEQKIIFTFKNLPKHIQDNQIKTHQRKIEEHKRALQIKREEEERKRKEEAERIRIEEEEKKEKKRLRAIRRLRESIRKNIFEVGMVKNEYYLEAISEIDNYEEEGHFSKSFFLQILVGVYGGLIGTLIITLSLFKKYVYPNENFISQETITEIISYYLAECNKIDVYFDISIEHKLKEVLNKDDLDINSLKTNTDLDLNDWNNITKVISDLSLNTDYILKQLLLKHSDAIQIEYYHMIVKALCILTEKGTWIDRINLVFKNNYCNTDFMNKISNYQALCKLNMNDNYDEIIETVPYVKDPKKKIKVPDFYDEIKFSRYFQQTPNHNILIYDKNAEFIIRNKLLEFCLRTINNEIDTRQAFITFNQYYEEFISNVHSDNFPNIQLFEFLNNEISTN